MSSIPPTSGLHHVTAICGSGSQNIAFYRDILGLRLVKKTVNFDMPTSYHLYYGDETGRPGTLLTFFVWIGLPPGREGRGQTLRTRFSTPVPLATWTSFFESKRISSSIQHWLGREELHFADPDGLQLALVSAAASSPPATSTERPGPISLEAVVLQVGEEGPTRSLLEAMGWTLSAQESARIRFQSPEPGPGSFLELEMCPDAPWARSGNGVVHHIAFRARDEEHQMQFHHLASRLGLKPSSVMDRNYFRSIYFRCPGGVLFEVATDKPGFAVDEAPEHLGESLCLPPSLEFRRRDIEQGLPAL
jgi:glyoxalase family protein